MLETHQDKERPMPDKTPSPAERRRAHRLARALIHFLIDEDDWTFRFEPLSTVLRARLKYGHAKSIVGVTDAEKQRLIIDPAHEDLLAVMIHETLHAMRPDASERTVLRLERLIRRHLTMRQARTLVRILGDRLT